MKMYLRSIVTLAGIWLSTFSWSAHAEDITVCNACSPFVLQSQARDLGNGDHYFYDMVYRKLSHYRVVGIINPMAIPGENRVSTGVASNGTVTLIPLAPSEQKIFDAVLQFYDEFGTLSPNVDLTPSPVMPSSAFTSKRIGLTALAIAQVDQRGYINAFDVVTTPVYREQVVNSVHYSTDPSFAIPAGLKASLSRIGTFISWLKMSGLPIISLPIDATVKYTFPDKSSIELVYTFETNRYEYQRGTGKDSVGNRIAEVQSDLSGGPGSTQNMTFPPGAAGGYAGGRQIEHIRALGVGLGGSVPVNSSGYSIACTTSGGVTQCAIVKTSGM